MDYKILISSFYKDVIWIQDVHSFNGSSMDIDLKVHIQLKNMYLSPMNKKMKVISRNNLDVCGHCLPRISETIHKISICGSMFLQWKKPTLGISRYPLCLIQMSVFGHLITSTHTVAGRKLLDFQSTVCWWKFRSNRLHPSIRNISHNILSTCTYSNNLDNRNEVIFCHILLDLCTESTCRKWVKFYLLWFIILIIVIILMLAIRWMRRFITFIDTMYENQWESWVLADEIPTKIGQLTEKEKHHLHDE
jgi:hypothetical protein